METENSACDDQEADDSVPLAPTESVLRRIHKNHVREAEHAERGFSIMRAGFVPNRFDDDGLSVFRSRFCSAEELDSAGRRPGEYYIVELALERLLERGFSVVPRPDPDQPPGHSLIPEITLGLYEREKQRSKELQNQLLPEI